MAREAAFPLLPANRLQGIFSAFPLHLFSACRLIEAITLHAFTLSLDIEPVSASGADIDITFANSSAIDICRKAAYPRPSRPKCAFHMVN